MILLISLSPAFKGDIIIDGGNSHFPDTIRRTKNWKKKDCCSSGQAYPAAKRRAQRPEHHAGWLTKRPHVKKIFQSICAKVENKPCCNWVGSDGAGHFVKMVHNGIEYGDMQLICEAYNIMSTALKMPAKEIHKVFAKWNKTELDSYLIEITADILSKTD